MRIHGTTTAADVAGLHPLVGQESAACLMGVYRDLEAFCHDRDIDPYHIQLCPKPQHLGDGVWFFLEFGGCDVAAWISPPPPEYIWGPFKPAAQARVYWPGPPPIGVPQRGVWIYPQEYTEDT